MSFIQQLLEAQQARHDRDDLVHIPVGHSPEHDAFVTAVEELNGSALYDPQVIRMKYVERANFLLIPYWFALDDGNQLTVREQAMAEADRVVRGVRPQMQADKAIWTPPEGLNLDNLTELLLCTPQTLITVTAMNMGAFPNIYDAATAALAACMGLVNRGNGGFSQEWILSPIVGTLAQVNDASDFWIGAHAEKNMLYALDSIAYVGFLRISFTHIMDSSDEARCTRQHRLRGAIYRNHFGRDYPRGVDTLGTSDHAACHSFSMGGAVGFFLMWINRPHCSPYLETRRNTIGDLWKRASIAVAGYDALMTHPMLASLQAVLGHRIEAVRYELEDASQVPWRTSSLSLLLSREAPLAISVQSDSLINLLGCLIAGAVAAEFIKGGLASSHYITGIVSRNAGAVAFWESFLSSVSRMSRDMKPEAFVAMVNDALAAMPEIVEVPRLEDAPVA